MNSEFHETTLST
jgi:hypothetical protein